MTKIITITAAKGGVGKTTITLTYATWLARHRKKVLLFDLDESCNLSHDFDIYSVERSVSELFQPQGSKFEIPKIHHITSQIDLISGDLLLDTYQNKILTEASQNQRILTYLRLLIQNHEFDYDYVIFDCHQNFNVATCNAILCSHAILSPLTPDQNGFNAKFDVKSRLDSYRAHGDHDPITNKPWVTADLFFIGNKVAHNKALSREELTLIKNDPQIISYIPEREVFNRATAEKTNIFDYLDRQKSISASFKSFLTIVDDTFTQVTQRINQTQPNLIDSIIRG